jgi:transcriptional regulator with XRE-family HTH domain
MNLSAKYNERLMSRKPPVFYEGIQLGRWRTTRGIHRVKMSRFIGIDPKTLAKFERGEYVRHRGQIVRLYEVAIAFHDSRVDLDKALERAPFTMGSLSQGRWITHRQPRSIV